MCMYYCWICCASMCCLNLYNKSNRDFFSVQLYLCIWGLINYLVFTYLVEVEIINSLSYLSDYIHLPYILKSVSSILIIKNLNTITNTPIENIDLKQQEYLSTNHYIALLNVFHSSIFQDSFSLIFSLIPIALQAFFDYKQQKGIEKSLDIFCLWGIGVAIEMVGWGNIWEFVKTMFSYFGIYFIEYPIIFGCSVFVGNQMEKVILNIENCTELIKTIGKSKKQLASLYAKEIFQYILLGFSIFFVRCCEEIIDWYHGYSPFFVSVIANMAYSYPAVVLLRYPKIRVPSRVLVNRDEAINYISFLFSTYFIRYAISFIY